MSLTGRIFGYLLVILIAFPVTVLITFSLLPFWRWLEASSNLESIGHSGPAVWCYLVVYCLIFLLLVLAMSKLGQGEKSKNAQ